MGIVTGFRMFKSNYLMTALTVLFMTALILCALLFCAITEASKAELALVAPLEAERGIYVFLSRRDPDYANVFELYDALPDTKELLLTTSLPAHDISAHQSANCIIYNTALAEKIAVNLLRGEWKPHSADGINYVVVNESMNRKIGETFTLQLKTANSEETMYVTVSGVMPDEASYVEFDGYATSALSSLTSNPLATDNTILFCNDRTDYLTSDYCDSALILFNDNVSEDKIAVLSENLKEHGYTNTVKEMFDGTRQDIKGYNSIFIPLYISLVLLAVVSTAVIILITFDRNKRLLTIVYYCGANKKILFTAVAVYFMSVFLLVAALSFIGFLALNAVLYELRVCPQTDVFLITLSALFAVFISSAAISGSKVSKKQITITIKDI